MKKYWIIFSQEFSLFSTYRFGILLRIVRSFITPLITLAALTTATSLGGFSASSLLPYYLIVGLTYTVVGSDVDEKIDEMAASGDVNNFLTKPLKFYNYMLVKEFSENAVVLTALLPIVFICFLVFGISTQVSLINFLLILVTTVISFILCFNFSYLIGLLSFWIDEFWGIHNVKSVIFIFLGGLVLPYTFFPSTVVEVLMWTPFPYMVSWVARALQGKFQPFDFVMALVWVILLFLLSRALENKAISKYSFTGS